MEFVIFNGYTKLWDELNNNVNFGTPTISDVEKGIYFFLLKEGIPVVGLKGRFRSDSYILRKFIKLLWFDSGPIFNSNIFSAKEQEVKKELMKEIIVWAKNENTSQVHFSHWSRELDSSVFIDHDIKKTYATFIVNLLKDGNEIFNEFSSANKRALKKASKENLEVRHFTKDNFKNENITDFLKLREITQKRAVSNNQEASMQLHSYQHIKTLLKNSYSFLSLVYYKDMAIAGALTVAGGKTLYYYLGGSDIIYTRETRASNYLHFEIIKYAKSLGFIYYDLGGCAVNPDENDPNYGVYRFKKSFSNSEMISYGAVYNIKPIKSKILNIILNNPQLIRVLKKITSL